MLDEGHLWMQLNDDEGEHSDASAGKLVITNAITSISTSPTLQLATIINAMSLTVLVDSRSTHSFIAAAAAGRVGLVP